MLSMLSLSQVHKHTNTITTFRTNLIRVLETKIFIVLIERKYKIMYKSLLQIFHNLLDSWNVFTEHNELSAILD